MRTHAVTSCYTRHRGRASPAKTPAVSDPSPTLPLWIIGQMALHVIRVFSDRFEFWLLTDKMLRLRPDLVQALLPSIDFHLPLSDKGFHLLRHAVLAPPLRSPRACCGYTT